MLPVVKGVDETTKQIFLSTLVLVVFSLAIPFAVPAFQQTPLYWLGALIGGGDIFAWCMEAIPGTTNAEFDAVISLFAVVHRHIILRDAR